MKRIKQAFQASNVQRSQLSGLEQNPQTGAFHIPLQQTPSCCPNSFAALSSCCKAHSFHGVQAENFFFFFVCGIPTVLMFSIWNKAYAVHQYLPVKIQNHANFSSRKDLKLYLSLQGNVGNLLKDHSFLLKRNDFLKTLSKGKVQAFSGSVWF